MLDTQLNQPNYQSTPEAYSYPLLIKQLLNRAKTTSTTQEIMYGDKVRMTYADFFKRINQMANVLAGLNLDAGDVVAVMDWDTNRYLEAFFAIPMSQLVLQTVNIRLSPEKILYTINHSAPKVLFINSDFAPLVKEYQFDNSSIEHIIWLDDNGVSYENVFEQHQHRVVGEYEALLANASDEFEFPDFDENTIATTFYTSGTTGNPKGVFFSHRQLVLHSLGLLATFGLMPEKQRLSFDDIYMPMTPMFHVHAWGLPYAATCAGIKQLYPGRYQPDLLVKYIREQKVTVTHCVPTILQMLLKQAQAENYQFTNLKMIVGGSKLTKGLANTAVNAGIECYSGYGMSETCPLACTTSFMEKNLSKEEDIARRCKTGNPVLMVDLQLWNDNNQKLANDGEATGEVVMRTPWLTQNYFKNPSAGSALWSGGYLHTGDIAKIDANGCLLITDRLKDVIKSGGEWISSLEIETILSLHPAVDDIAVIGIEDEKWGERPLALIVKRADKADVTGDEILQMAINASEKGIIPNYAVPQQLKFLDELPKTSVGKHDKKLMRQLYTN